MQIRLLLFFFTLVTLSCGRERGPNDSTEKETENRKTTVADIEEGIRSYIKSETNRNGGYFPLVQKGDTMRLKLVRVHTEYLSNLGPNSHFACVDLADENGDVYDVDFFLTGRPGDMDVTQTTLHKENGKPYYNWKQAEDKTWKRVPVKESGNLLMGVVEGKDAFAFYYKVILPEITKPSKIWIPLASSDEWQNVKLKVINSPKEGRRLKEPEFGNEYLYCELGPEDGKGVILLEYEIERKEKSSYEGSNEDRSRYLRSSDLLPVGGRFGSIVDEILKGKKGESDLMKARAIYDFIVDTVRYRKAGQYGTGDANYACDTRSGNCTEFHSYFISLARSAGIPARFAIGAAIPAERNEGGVNGYHCWAEFYAEGKWWPIDISEANKYSALSSYYFGRHPANRIEFSKGRDIILEPLPKSGPVPFFAYPLLEIDGIPATVKTSFSFERRSHSQTS